MNIKLLGLPGRSVLINLEGNAIHRRRGDLRKRNSICPACGSSTVVEIICTEPADQDTQEDYLIGGCCVVTGSPTHACKDCGYNWGRYADHGFAKRIVLVKAYVGGYFGACYHVEADREIGTIKYRKTIDNKEFKKETAITWDKLIKGLEENDFEYWLDEYFENVFDGTSWKVEVILDNGDVINKHGSNSFPGKWREFCKMVTELSGQTFE